MSIEQCRARGNAAFKDGDYAAALRLYTAALESPGPAAVADGSAAVPLLTNRALAALRLGRAADAAADAEAALLLDPANTKAAFRAAAARLLHGDGEAAARHAALLPQRAADGGPEPPAWRALRLHAAALQRRAAAVRAAGASPHAHQLLAALAVEAEGEGDAEDGCEPAELLRQLAGLLRQGSSGSSPGGEEVSAAQGIAAIETSPRGYRLLLFFLSDPDPATQQAAAAALQAAAQAGVGSPPAAVLWPAQVWERLLALACEPQQGSAAAVATDLLLWAAERDGWVRLQVLTHPLAAPDGAEPSGVAPLARIAAALGGSERQLPAAAAGAAAQLFRAYASDATAAEALARLRCRPLLALLRAAAADDEAEEASAAGEAAPEPSSASGLGASEAAALHQLRLKRRQVYDARHVALRRSLLTAAAELAGASRELLLAEAVQVAGNSAGSGGAKRGMQAGEFLTELLALARRLHEQQPQRTAPSLGPDGTPRAFAADFRDNPAGDFLLSLDLGDEGGPGSAREGAAGSPSNHSSGSGSGGGGSGNPAPTPTLLELALRLLRSTAGAGASAAAALHRRGLLGLCEELCAYCTPAVVAAAQRLTAAVADRVPAAADELLAAPHVPALAALALHSASQQRQAAALDKLSGLADTCSGDDFALLTASGPGATGAAAHECAVFKAWQLLRPGADVASVPAQPPSGLQDAARRFLLRCCERAQRQQGLAPAAAPRGGVWEAIGRPALARLLQAEQAAAGVSAGGQAGQQREPAFQGLSKGFLGSKAQLTATAAAPAAASSAPAAAAASASSAAVSHSYKRGAVTIEEMPVDADGGSSLRAAAMQAAASGKPAAGPEAAGAATPQHQQHQPQEQEQRRLLEENQLAEGAAAAEEAEEGSEEEEIPELRDVWDSSSSASAEQRRARAAWLALPQDRKIRWNQTSQDVSVTIAVPEGTRASEVHVDLSATQLALGLRWAGRVLGGELHRRVRPADCHWCLEGCELHLQLAKAEGGAWWRALLQGQEGERSYRELLKEAVEADEPVQPYDQLDDSAKALIASIQERQAYIAAGLVDPEGFDDFRVVLGEASLAAQQ